MAILQGDLRVGEANSTMWHTRFRQAGLPWYLAAVFIIPLSAILTGLLSDAAGRAVGIELPQAPLVGLALGLVPYFMVVRRLALSQFRGRMRARGLPLVFPMRLEVGPGGIVCDCGGVYQRAEWSCVTEVFQAKRYWVFLAQSTPIYAPIRMFADKAAERTFLEEALNYMSAPAQARSAKARAVAAALDAA